MRGLGALGVAVTVVGGALYLLGVLVGLFWIAATVQGAAAQWVEVVRQAVRG